jgi:hypothetical protein
MHVLLLSEGRDAAVINLARRLTKLQCVSLTNPAETCSLPTKSARIIAQLQTSPILKQMTSKKPMFDDHIIQFSPIKQQLILPKHTRYRQNLPESSHNIKPRQYLTEDLA